jgi:hypothetical protein
MLSDTILDAAEEIEKDLARATAGNRPMYLDWQRDHIKSLCEEMKAIGWEIGSHPERWHDMNPNKITVTQAKEIMTEHTNGTVSDLAPTNGGRVRLEGEFNLAQLEALAVIVRDHAGERAFGSKELTKHWYTEGMLDEQQKEKKE